MLISSRSDCSSKFTVLVAFRFITKRHFHVEVVQGWKRYAKKRGAHAKLLLNLLFGGRSEGFYIWYLEKIQVIIGFNVV